MRSKYFPCCTIFNFHLIIFDFPVFLEFTAFLNLDEHLRYSSSNSCGYHIIGLKIMYEKRKKPISLVFFQFSTIASTKTTLSIVQFFTWQKFFRFSVFVHIFRQLKITEFCFPIFWAKYLLSMTCIFHFKQLFLFKPCYLNIFNRWVLPPADFTLLCYYHGVRSNIQCHLFTSNKTWPQIP